MMMSNKNRRRQSNLALILTTIIPTLLVSEPCAWANHWSLEGGLITTGYFPTAPGESGAYGGLGASGTISYEIVGWSFGIRTQGTLSSNSPFHLLAGSYDIKGDLGKREYGLAALTRYFFNSTPRNRRWYLEFLFAARQTDYIHAESVYSIPQSPDYVRLFIRGGGFSIGAGYRPIKGPYFFQVNYELDHYETLEIVGEVNHLHQIVAEPALNSNYFTHSLFITVGLDVFGR
jgi:hypothetical protein